MENESTQESPKVMTKEQMIQWWEVNGWLDPLCERCKSFYEADLPSNVHEPRHLGSGNCESGRYPHCSCDRCF